MNQHKNNAIIVFMCVIYDGLAGRNACSGGVMHRYRS
jgi:hypothetical protein